MVAVAAQTIQRDNFIGALADKLHAETAPRESAKAVDMGRWIAKALYCKGDGTPLGPPIRLSYTELADKIGATYRWAHELGQRLIAGDWFEHFNVPRNDGGKYVDGYFYAGRRLTCLWWTVYYAHHPRKPRITDRMKTSSQSFPLRERTGKPQGSSPFLANQQTWERTPEEVAQAGFAAIYAKLGPRRQQ